jgi:hydroxymethylpyrimidine/phosphomethylpyrimidine kinase
MAVLMIGGIDSSGGAGLLRDCATAAAFGVEARVAVTAVTAQTDGAVLAAEMCSPTTLAAQINAAFAQGHVGAVKIGMLGTAEAVRTVAETLDAYMPRPLVLDPVIASSSGKRLLDEAGVRELLEKLLPQVTLITPNLPELSHFAAVLQVPEVAVAGRLLDLGAGAVLVKGGHAEGNMVEDRLLTAEFSECFRAPRLPGSLRGTGCSLAAAVACSLAEGLSLSEACKRAQSHVRQRFLVSL